MVHRCSAPGPVTENGREVYRCTQCSRRMATVTDLTEQSPSPGTSGSGDGEDG